MKKPLTPEQAEALYLLAKRIVDKKRRKHSKQLTVMRRNTNNERNYNIYTTKH